MAAGDAGLIRQAAAALRESCDRLFHDGEALCLSAAALRALHHNFAAISLETGGAGYAGGEFEVVAGSALVQSQALLDLQFLYDVAQLSRRLRVRRGLQPPDGPLPLTAFRRLERLELEAVPVCQVHGLQARRPYLRALLCTGGVAELAELLARCGGDATSPFLWEELTEVRLSRCQLAALDDSLRLAPRIQLLDLSHNLLTAADGLQPLAGLQRLSLAANLLEVVPPLSAPAYRTLCWLSLRSNRLEALDGLELMVGLKYLDISYNFLPSHDLLSPVAELYRLQSLHLSGNPLCCFSDHRQRTVRHLHELCRNELFCLDGRRLRRSELAERRPPAAGRPVPRGAGPSSSPAAVRHGQRAWPPPSERASAPQLRAAAEPARQRPPRLRGEHPPPDAGQPRPPPTGSDSSSPRPRRRRSKKRSRVNLADISDMDSTSLGLPTSGSINDVSCATDGDKAELPSHLATREQIEGLRQQLGADWLHSRGGTLVQQLLGLPQQPPPTFTVGSLAESDSGGTAAASDAPPSPPPPPPPPPPPLPPAPAQRQSPVGAERPPPAGSSGESGRPFPELSLYPSRDRDQSWEQESSEEEDEEDVVCLVVARRLLRGRLQEDVMITVTQAALKEKELDAGRTVAEWDLQSVEACHITKMEPLTVQLNFDTVKKEKQERNYLMEQSEWEELSAALLPLIEERLASELAANALQCIKCAAEFSDALARTAAAQHDKQAGRFRQVQTCPNCGSNMIIRAEKVSHPNSEVARSPTTLAKNSSQKYPPKKRLSRKKMVASTPRHVMHERAEGSQGSLGVDDTTGDAAPSESSSFTTRAEVHTDSSVSVVTPDPTESRQKAGSSEPSEPSESRTKTDSDVEVISNPSESSIEVILDTVAKSRNGTGDPARKAPEPTVVATTEASVKTPDTPTSEPARNGVPMQESSSSGPKRIGSMSASICTVRDGREQTGQPPPPPPPLPSTAAAPDSADLSSTLSPESSASDAASPADGGAAPRQNGAAPCDDGQDEGEDVLRSWLSEGESEAVEEAGLGRVLFWHDDLARVDHRLQLYLDINLLEPDEQILFVVKCKYALDPRYVELDCVLIVSSRNIYVMEITGDDSEQLERWLRLRLTRPLAEVASLGALLHCHGLAVQLVGRDPALNSQLLLLVRDSCRGQLLLRHLREACPRAAASELWQRTQRHQVEHMLSGDSAADVSLSQLFFVDLVADDGGAAPVMLCITPTDLLLMESDLRWLVPGHGDVKIPMRDREKVANIVGLELLRCAAAGRPGVRLLFQDAGSGAEHSWRLAAGTRAALADLVSALREPWARSVGAHLQTLCDVYRTAEGDVLHLGPLADLTGWLKVTAVRRPAATAPRQQ